MIYLASPYSHKDPAIMVARHAAVEKYIATCMAKPANDGQHLISPIVHFHVMALKYNLPKDAEFWWEYNQALLRVCKSMRVLKIDGWESSVGVQREIGFMTGLNRTIRYVKL